jgi:Nucleotidyltransferase domain
MPSVGELPDAIAELCALLAPIKGVEAVVIGGSRAAGTADAASDWDIGLYYRGDIDLRPLTIYGEVHPPGSWGRIMNGGAWLSFRGIKVDVLLRDIDIVSYWVAQARRGLYEVDALLGYLAGVPTYCLMAELALNRPWHGRLAKAGHYPEKLAQVGERRWRLHAEFSLEHARMRADRGDIIGTAGQAAKAVIETAHALACARHRWVLNEKKLIDGSGLEGLHAWFSDIPARSPQLLIWLDGLRIALKRA